MLSLLICQLTARKGVSVFFLAPLWPYRVAAFVTLDGNVTSVIDLQDHRFSENHDGGPESDTSAVRWGVSGLANVEHTLFITFSTGWDWLVLDALQYVPNSLLCWFEVSTETQIHPGRRS